MLTSDDLPATWAVADLAAREGRDETMRFVRWELRALVFAAACGAVTWRVGRGDLDVLAAIGTTAFVAGIVMGVYHAKRAPEEKWYRGRAAAESAKTLAIRYAVGGDPFPSNDATADDRLLGRLEQVIDVLSAVDVPAHGTDRPQLSPKMQEIRSADLDVRREVYRQDRLQDQVDWYADRANDHSRSARRWVQVAIAANVVGVVAGLARFVNAFDADLLGVAAAVAAAASAWTQMLQHRSLATSYSIAALELRLVLDREPGVDEQGWPLFVSDAEDAISREHTMWLARRGHPR